MKKLKLIIHLSLFIVLLGAAGCQTTRPDGDERPSLEDWQYVEETKNEERGTKND